MARLEAARPRRVGVLNAQPLVATDELLVRVADEATGQQVSLHEHLEAVADAEDRHPLRRGIRDFAHDRRVGGDSAGTQIVAVAEAAGKHESVDATEVVVAVPQRNGLAAGDTDGALGVAIVERTGERDDPDADGHSMTSIPTTSSITELERISSAIR